MTAHWQEKLYSTLPISLQNLACTIEGKRQRKLRFGGEFEKLLEWLEQSQWWSAKQIRVYQEAELQKLIHHAYHTTPFYRRRFDEHKLKPADIKTLADLQKLPLLTKEDVRNHFREMVSSEFNSKEMKLCQTSGTTGKSLKFYQEPRAIQFRWAVWWRHRQRFGVKFDSPYATFTGLAAVPLAQNQPPFWRENRALHQTIFTMHHLTPGKIETIVERLNEGGFTYYAGYPSILFVLAEFIERFDYAISAPPKKIFTGAENLYEHHRQLIAKIFKAEVTDEYGFSEGCGNASRCERDRFHEDFEFGILECGEPEFLDENTRQGRIIATGFSSYGMPFIRYDVGDVGTWKMDNCACGRYSNALTQINGRIEDFVITPEGSRILRFDYIFKDTQQVCDAQVVQKESGGVVLRIVRRPAYSQRDEAHLRDAMREKISPTLLVEFEYVEEIERESNGKIRAVKSFLKPEIVNAKSILS
ncbi:MAG: phenylacetate--CoA ligase family protein [Acidobacteriota bacterium]